MLVCIVQYCIFTWTNPDNDTRYYPVLYLNWHVLDYTVFVSDLYCILHGNTKTILFRAMFLHLISESTAVVSTFYILYTKSRNQYHTIHYCLYTMYTVSSQYRYPVTWRYLNGVQNGYVCYRYDTVYRYCRIGTVAISTLKWHWKSTVQCRFVYCDINHVQ